MKIYFDGVECSGKLSVQKCVHESRTGGRGDELSIIFNDNRQQWNEWFGDRPKKIRIVQNNFDSGSLNIFRFDKSAFAVAVHAFSLPLGYNAVSCKSWEDVYFFQICEEIASRHGLTCEFLGVENRKYTYVEQAQQKDFDFLADRARLEGCSVLVFNGKVVVYSDSAIASLGGAEKTVKIQNSTPISFSDIFEKIGKLNLVNSEFSAEATDSTGTAQKTVFVPAKITDQGEADRWAKNLLSHYNKDAETGCFTTDLSTDISAGTLLKIECAIDSGLNCSGVAAIVRHDFGRKLSKVFFRKT